MSDMGGLPKLPAVCSQCGEPFSARACGPTHALIWNAIEAPVMHAAEQALQTNDRVQKRFRARGRGAPHA